MHYSISNNVEDKCNNFLCLVMTVSFQLWRFLQNKSTDGHRLKKRLCDWIIIYIIFILFIFS